MRLQTNETTAQARDRINRQAEAIRLREDAKVLRRYSAWGSADWAERLAAKVLGVPVDPRKLTFLTLDEMAELAAAERTEAAA